MRFAIPLPLSIALAMPLASQAQVEPEIHKMCLEVRDYVGCVEKNQTSIQELRKPMNQNLDIMNRPVIENWILYESPDAKSVAYVNPATARKVQVRSVFGRYFEFSYLKRYRVPAILATQGYYTNIHPKKTTCQREVNKEVCTTYPAVRKWIPGRQFTPESVNEVKDHAIVDCKDETARWSQNNRRWRKADIYFLKRAMNDFCDKVESLEESKNMKYSGGYPTSDDLKFLKSL